MTVLEQLIELSPCKVEFVSMLDMPHPCAEGAYWWSHCIPSYLIRVKKTTTEDEKVYILAHEIGHAMCDAKDCKCREMVKNGDHTLAEYHASKYALMWLLKHKCRRALKYACEIVEKWTEAYGGDHQEAAKKVMKLKLWQKCLDYVEEQTHSV